MTIDATQVLPAAALGTASTWSSGGKQAWLGAMSAVSSRALIS